MQSRVYACTLSSFVLSSRISVLNKTNSGRKGFIHNSPSPREAMAEAQSETEEETEGCCCWIRNCSFTWKPYSLAMTTQLVTGTAVVPSQARGLCLYQWQHTGSQETELIESQQLQDTENLKKNHLLWKSREKLCPSLVCGCDKMPWPKTTWEERVYVA